MIGDHIRTLKAGRWTHAIDCGDETVIGLAEEAAQPLRVRRSYRPEFVAGADSVEVVRHRERTFPADEVVARAYSRISDPALASMFRDSEAFAEWCTTGRLPSPANVAISAAGASRAPAPAARPAPAAPRAPARKKPAAKAKPARGAKPARRARKARASRKGTKVRARARRKPARRA
ncbi:MAG TPA: hypothetical protein VFL83_10165 [Anaeromyxobacter sp.]|nr:hypothetical protein [Anaeromyxobacter sp.]